MELVNKLLTALLLLLLVFGALLMLDGFKLILHIDPVIQLIVGIVFALIATGILVARK